MLNGLTEEDETVVDVWYLLGLTNKLRADFEAGEASGDSGKEAAEGYLGNARYYLKKALRVHAKHPVKDKEMVAHVKELIAEAGPGDGDEDNSDDDDDEGWEDFGESSDDGEKPAEEDMDAS